MFGGVAGSPGCILFVAKPVAAPGGGGEELGPELLTNGDFSSSSGWNLDGATISGGKLLLDSGGGDFSEVSQSVLLENGEVYRLTITVEALSGALFLFLGSVQLDAALLGIGTTSYDVTVSSADTVALYGDAPISATIDSISVKKLL